VDIANPVFSLEVSSDWYRQRPVRIAFALSLLIHGMAIALLPGLRVPRPEQPPPLVVELVELPQPENPVLAPQPQPRRQPERAPLPRPAPLRQTRPEPLPVPAPIHTEPVLPERPEVRREPTPEPVPQAPDARRETSPPVAPPQAQPATQPAPAEPQVAAKPQAPAPPVSEPRLSLDAALKAYGEMLAQAIGKRKDYPRLARLRNWQGTTELKLQIDSDGKLRDVAVGHSSGFPVLDAAAIRIVHESVPLPDAPDALRGREWILTVPVVFKLEAS
jgi:periplasmic protein TonB